MTTLESATHGSFTGTDVPDFDILNTCVKCGLCLTTCPTYRETYREQSSPRGRLHLMHAVYENRIDVLDPVFTGQMQECLDCRACEAVCPSGVRYGEVLEASRAQIETVRRTRGKRSLVERMLRLAVFRLLFANMRLFRAVSTIAAVYQSSGLQSLARASGLLRVMRLDRLESQLPDMTARFFVARDQRVAAAGEQRGRAGLLTGCIMHTAFAGVDRATERVLARNGWEVAIPAEQGCCGALHVHAGETELGRSLMRRNIEAFERSGADVIVTNAAGCGAAMKEYGRLLENDLTWAQRAQNFSSRVRDVTELLAESPLRGPLGEIDVSVTYQDACHLAHAQRITDAPRRLLRSIPGLRLSEMAESSLCCGSAGIYNITQPEMSGRLRQRKLSHALATGASVIASANPGCILQLRSGLRRVTETTAGTVQVRHVIELLDQAYAAARENVSSH